MGTLRDLRRGDKERSEADSEKVRLFARLEELRSRQGKTWKEISQIIQEEGLGGSDESPTSNALRKRYTRWSQSEKGIPGESSPVSETETEQEQGITDFDRLQKHRMGSALKGFEGGGSVPDGSVEDAIAGLVTLNKTLLEQIQESNRLIQRLEKRLEEQERKSSHTGIDIEQPVTTRDLLELLKEATAGRLQMMHIEEERKDYPSREEVHQLIDEIVEERVEAELKSMLTPEGSFAGELSNLVDRRLRILFSGGEPVVKTAHPGPGRGRRGRTHKKFSASLEETLFERVRSLPGQFSGHLSNALEAYLSVVEEKTED